MLVFFLVVFLFIALLFFMRLLSPREIDDVSPEIFCSEEVLEKSDVLWIIPKFENKSISENKEWCDYILSLNKTLGLHGVYHSFHEFEVDRDLEYLSQGDDLVGPQGGIDIFKECFGFEPELFKPPQLKISQENENLIKENNMEFNGRINQLTHKVYHCNDSGLFLNKFIDLF